MCNTLHIRRGQAYTRGTTSVCRKAASRDPNRSAGCTGPSPSRPTACYAGFRRATPKGIPSIAFAASHPPAVLWEGKTDVLFFFSVLVNISVILAPYALQVKDENRKKPQKNRYFSGIWKNIGIGLLFSGAHSCFSKEYKRIKNERVQDPPLFFIEFHSQTAQGDK